MGRVDEVLEILLCSELRIQGVIIPDIVSVVRIGRMRRRQPEGRDSHPVQVIQVVLDALEVTPTVAVGIGE